MTTFLRRFWAYRWWTCSRWMRAEGRACYGWRDHRNGDDGYEPMSRYGRP